MASTVESLLPSQNKLASSANRLNSKKSEHKWKSFTSMRNNKGPRTDPCGTPQVTEHSQDVTLFMVTIWFLLLKYEINHCLAIPRTP